MSATPGTWRVVRYHAFAYRKVWLAQVSAAIVFPLFFLASLGLGVGRYVDRGGGAAALQGTRYLAFLAPGLLASSIAQAAAGDSLWPILGGFVWQRTWVGQASTPLGGRDIATGWVLWQGIRLTAVAAAFLAACTAFGAIGSWWALLVPFAAGLTGLGLAVPLAAFASTRTTDGAFPMVMRLFVIPLFLFSGAFFPISQLPAAIRPIAWVTPLWHGVEVCRALALGRIPVAATLGHLAVLALFVAVGTALLRLSFQRRLSA